MTPMRLLPAAAGTVLAAMMVIVPAAPASAATANITITGPAAGAQLTSSSVAITGSANIDPGLLGSNAISDLKVAVTFEGGAFDSCDDGGCGAGAGHASTNFLLHTSCPHQKWPLRGHGQCHRQRVPPRQHAGAHGADGFGHYRLQRRYPPGRA